MFRSAKMLQSKKRRNDTNTVEIVGTSSSTVICPWQIPRTIGKGIPGELTLSCRSLDVQILTTESNLRWADKTIHIDAGPLSRSKDMWDYYCVRCLERVRYLV